jgi:putative ABC transport system permease protein
LSYDTGVFTISPSATGMETYDRQRAAAMNFFNLFKHISLKRVRLQKVHTLMTVAGICLGVAAIVSIGIVNKSVMHSFEDSINRVTGKAALQVTGAASGFPEELIERVQKVPGVEYAMPVIDTQGILVKGRERTLMILGVDVLQDGNIRDYKLAGDNADIPDPLLFLARPDSILLTKEMAAREGIAIDQTIRIQTVRGIRTFRVRGLLDPEGPAKTMGGNIAIMDYPAAQMAFGKEGRIDRIDVSLLPEEDIEIVRERIKKTLPEGYTVVTPEGRTKQVEVLISHFQKNINLISFIAVFVGMYLIYNAVSISVVQRKKEIGILRALGTTRLQIITLFLGETAVMAVVGSAAGPCRSCIFGHRSRNCPSPGQDSSQVLLPASRRASQRHYSPPWQARASHRSRPYALCPTPKKDCSPAGGCR